ncbi:TonB C-terminal domain-containing protein [bacterium]|nr:TonB C-terminal domain-containing protein [bacterium]
MSEFIQHNAVHDPVWRRYFVTSAILHVVVAGVLFLLAGMHDLFPQKSVKEVRFVRLAGGGQNRPGWIKPTTAPPDESPISDSKPKPQPVVEKPKPETTQKPKAESKPQPQKDIALQSEQTSKETSAIEKEEEPVQQAASVPVVGETGEGVGPKPGPQGPGMGATTEADFPGGSQYLARLETEVQRRFNFRGRNSGEYAEYHFFIEKDGSIKDLLLVKASGIASLDLAARSAVMRAKLAPLPGTFPHSRLGVTYRFYDAD